MEDSDDSSDGNNIIQSLQVIGFSAEKLVDGKFPVIVASRTDGDRKILVRMNMTKNPTAVIEYKNGISMKYLIAKDAIGKSLEALQALENGEPFNSLWKYFLSCTLA